MASSTAPLTVDLKLTHENIQRRFSCSSKRPSWKALSSQIKERFGLSEGFNLGLSYIDDDGEIVVLSSDEELDQIWPVITEDDERELDSLPPLRFNVIQLQSSQSTVAADATAAYRRDSATVSNASVTDTIEAEEDMVDEVASGISDIEIIDDDKVKSNDKDKEDPKKKKTTLQEDIKHFVDTVKSAVENNEDIHKSFDKVIAHIHKPLHDKPKQPEDGAPEQEEGGIIALALLVEETGKMDSVTAGIVSALLAPALMMGPHPRPGPGFPPPPPPPGPHGPHGRHHYRGGLPPPFPPHFGEGRRRGCMPPPPPPHFFPHGPPGFERHFERGPFGHHALPPFPPMFRHDFFDPRGDHRGRGCPYGMPPAPPHFGAHLRREYPMSGFHPASSYHDGDIAHGFDDVAFGPHRHPGRHGGPFDAYHHKHHNLNMRYWQEDEDLPDHSEAMRMDELESDSETSSNSSASSSSGEEEETLPHYGRHARFEGGRFGPPHGHGMSGPHAGPHGPPRPPYGGPPERGRPTGKHGRHRHGPGHGHGPRGPPRHGDMPPHPPPPPHHPAEGRHRGRHHDRPHHHRRWA